VSLGFGVWVLGLGFREAKTVRSENARACQRRSAFACPNAAPGKQMQPAQASTLTQLLLALGRAERHDETNGKCCDHGQHHAATRRAPLLPHASEDRQTRQRSPSPASAPEQPQLFRACTGRVLFRAPDREHGRKLRDHASLESALVPF